jgi:hypothetical protein
VSRALIRMMTKKGHYHGVPPAGPGGTVGPQRLLLSNWPCTPPDPIDPRNPIAERLGVASPVNLHQTITRYSALIKAGGDWIVDGVNYDVKGVGPYDGPTRLAASEAFMVLYLERPVR